MRDEVLLRLYHELIDAGVDASNILVITDSRHHSGRLKKAIISRHKGTLGELRVVTFSSLARTLVEDYFPLLGYRLPPKLLTGPEQRLVIQQLYPGKSMGYIQEVFDLFYRWEENQYTYDEIKILSETYDRPQWLEIHPFYEQYQQQLSTANKLDYGLLLHKGLEVIEKLGSQSGYNHVLISDFQDINYSQFKMAQTLANYSASFIALGDEREAINGFRGSSSLYFSNFNQWSADGNCWVWDGTEVVAENPQIATQHALPSDTLVYWQDFRDYTQEVQWAADQAARLILEEKVSPDKVAILYRSLRKSSLPHLSRILSEYEIPFKVYGSAENLYHKPYIKELISLLFFLGQESGLQLSIGLPPQLLLFSNLFGFLPRELKTISRTFELTVDHEYIHNLLALRDTTKLDDISLRRKLEEFQFGFSKCRDRMDAGLSGLVRHCWETFPYYETLAGEGKDELKDFQEFFKECLDYEKENIASSPREQLVGFLQMVLTSHFSEDRAEEDLGEPLNRVSILPIHRVKGLSYEYTFILELSEEILPQRYRSTELADPLLLTKSPFEKEGSGGLGRQLLFEENERRLFYLGCHAAQKGLFLSSSKITSTQVDLKPSRFKLEISSQLKEKSPPPLKVHSSLNTLEKELRKKLSSGPLNPEDPDFLKRAADYYQLQLITGEKLHQPWKEIFLTQSAERPFSSEKMILSASKIQAYLDCPLKFKYGLLNLPEETPDAFLYGQILHRVLEKLHDPLHPLLPERGAVKSLMDEGFEKARFNYLAVKEYSRKRMEEELYFYLDKIHTLPPVAVQKVEQSFTLRWQGTSFRGRIDRIDRLEDGSLELIDYKSSSSKITKADAQADIQLGLYLMAFSDESELSKLGQVRKLSYWYIPSMGPKSDGKVSVFPDDQYLSNIRQKLDNVLQGIFMERFPPKPKAYNTCSSCNYQGICPRFDQGVTSDVRGTR